MTTGGKCVALTHAPSPSLVDCELTFLKRAQISITRAVQQHHQYIEALRKGCGVVETLNTSPNAPDSVFVEDCALVLDEVAIMMSMAGPSRRQEIAGVEAALSHYRETKRIEPGAKLEGGDILQMGKRLFVGVSSRSNRAGFDALRKIVEPLGYEVVSVPVRGCLHLKTAVTAVDEGTLLMNANWVGADLFRGYSCIAVDSREPFAANVLRAGKLLLMNGACPVTAGRVAKLGIPVTSLDISEFMKAEAGLTCMSLIFSA